uniref:Uncharacterized protein LOC112817057 n=1 Tax=Callorhinus ursinus TaxID=34884 RepID=A0A3Q7ND86_CALUR|nr:uncharacterized protein LOC112817057 [Callorhinus ursinus]
MGFPQRQAPMRDRGTRRGGGVEGTGAGSGLRGGGSCSGGGNRASFPTFFTSHGARAPAAPHAAEGRCGGPTRLPARPSDARPSPHFKALLTTSRAVRPTSASAAPQRAPQRARAMPPATAAPRAAGMRVRVGRVTGGARASADGDRSASDAPPPLTEGLRGSTLKQQPASLTRHLRDRRAPSTGVRSHCQRSRDAASRHRPKARKRLSPQRATTGEPPQPRLPRHRPLLRFQFFHWVTGHAPGGPRRELPEIGQPDCFPRDTNFSPPVTTSSVHTTEFPG